MFILWSGFGYLVPVLAVGFVVASMPLAGHVNEDALASLVYAGLAITLWFSGRRLNRKAEAGIKRAHSFFFIAMEYWALLPGLLYLLMLQKSLFG